VEVGGQTKFVCVDGPEFDGHQVDFELLMARLRMYLPEEKKAMDAWKSEMSKRSGAPDAGPTSVGEDDGR
jgi:ferredoxin--NADP+ reductase